MNPQTTEDQHISFTRPQTAASAQAIDVPGVPVPALEPPLPASPAILQPTVPVHAAQATPEQPQASASPASQAGSPSAQMPAEAADNDVIEKEWVVKAKEIVAATQQDPYKQVQEINKLKADYMKKRYDKDIKLADE